MEENRYDTDSLPIQSQRQNLNNHHQKQQKTPALVFRIIVILVVITVLLMTGFTILSYETLQNTASKTKGYLLNYLPIHAGELQYGRIPVEYWEHRLKMLKAMGLNAVSSYVMWNHHQVRKGVFDFQNNNKNLKKYLELTQKIGLNVLLRPGPYVCAQWDFGGLPSRLLGIDNLTIRSADQLYEKEVKIYFQALAPVIKPFLASRGGNIILLQIENQYGYIGEDNKHILNLAQMWKDLDVDCEFYIEDPGQGWKTSYWPKAHVGMSTTAATLLRYVDIQISAQKSAQSIIFSGQIYSGWFTEWGWDWGTVDNEELMNSIKVLLQNNRSFSLYVAHGGTNFGVTAGANGNNGFYQYLPHITSYDYDAPINQIGKPTELYYQIRNLIKHHYKDQIVVPDIPESLPSITIQQFMPEPQAYLWDNLPEPALVNSDLVYFESPQLQMYNQGLVIYETVLPEARTYYFDATIRDFGLIYVDNELAMQVLRRTTKVVPFQIECQKQEGCVLRILVQAMGHKNFGVDQRQDKKGLVHFQQIGSANTYKWNIFKISVLNSQFGEWNSTNIQISYPAIFRAQLQLQSTGDTYFDMKEFKKGYLYVNGHLLGRYWDLGPQERLFCPGVWLRKGVNQIVLLELLESGLQSVKGVESLKG